VRISWIAAAAATGIIVIAGCGGGDDQSTTQAASTPTATTSRGALALEPIADGDFGQAVYVTQPPGNDSDLYVVDRTGKVDIVRDGSKLDEPFLDISSKVSTEVEQGLLSIAFAPDYESSGVFYAYYTDKDGNQNVVELKRSAGDPDKADPASEREVLKMADFAPNHNGGLLVFGPEGQLYIGTGDGGGRGDPRRNAQNPDSLLGKILRIADPSRPGAKPEVYALGLRNPWRFDFDEQSGNLIIGDVGQDEFEEVDVVPIAEAEGSNFGWSELEGFAPFNSDQSAADAVDPAFVYSHGQGCSVNGGYVIHDPSLPSLDGRYLYSDFCSGEIRSLKLTGTDLGEDKPTGLSTQSPTSFGIDNAGHVYVTSINGDVSQITEK
jgi:glucose/arabinose dehydrogenase